LDHLASATDRRPMASVTDRRPTTSTPTDDRRHVFVLIAPRYTLIVSRL
jgi:hypothetical protein